MMTYEKFINSFKLYTRDIVKITGMSEKGVCDVLRHASNVQRMINIANDYVKNAKDSVEKANNSFEEAMNATKSILKVQIGHQNVKSFHTEKVEQAVEILEEVKRFHKDKIEQVFKFLGEVNEPINSQKYYINVLENNLEGYRISLTTLFILFPKETIKLKDTIESLGGLEIWFNLFVKELSRSELIEMLVDGNK